MASEPIVTVFDLPVAKRRTLSDSQNWLDFLALTKPEVNFLILVTTFAASLYYGACFAFRKSNASARQLLAASIIYLPSLFLLLILLHEVSRGLHL